MALAEQMKAIVASAQGGASQYEEAVNTVRKVADELESELEEAIGSRVLNVKLTTGHKVSLGQQYRFEVAIDGVINDTFLRFYVPADGYPTTLSLFEDETVACADAAQLEEALVKFLGRAPVNKRLGALMSIAKERAGQSGSTTTP